ncbi:MAG: YihA family ribosome biogenesis GTP-binding protein [Deltaproteobacteria bacterium]|nr:YihA family ribosome biogenesis GTP-binding protein [Deltaproteobacteria bacterium]
MKIVSAKFIKSASHPSHYPEEKLPEIAFAGKSNVGKSSLINVLVRQKSLARTSNTPGRTQLINFFSVNDTYALVDLPGYGFARVPESVRKNWQPMVEAYLKSRKMLKLVILIVDARRDLSQQDLDLANWLIVNRIPFLFVLTKIDKLSKNQLNASLRKFKAISGLPEDFSPVLFSARTGQGRDILWAEIDRAAHTL